MPKDVKVIKKKTVVVKRKKHRVHWSKIVKVHQLDDSEEDRRSIWMKIAADRARVRRRMQRVAAVLEPVLMKHYQR